MICVVMGISAWTGMAHYSKEFNRYPPRLYPLGNSHFQKRSMNHNCQLSSLKDLKKYIGETAYNYIRDESQVGVLLKLADSNYVWCAKIVHHFLTQQLAISRMHEIWCLIEGHPLRFSLHEYEDITGLKCHTIESVDKYDLDHTELWDELEVEPTVGPNWFELEAGLKKCHRWTYENKLMLGLLYVVHVGIMGLARTSRIPLSYAVTVMHDDVFEAFPWGRVGFKCLIDSIKIVALENRSYSIHGCVHALAIWAYDSVSELEKKCGKEIVGDDDDDEEKPALLRWNGSRPRFTIGEFLASVKRKKDKLNVNMVSFRPMEEIYPSWPGEEAAVIGECEGEHKPLDNLLSDIMNGTLNPKQWEAVEKKGYKRKMFSESNDDDDDFVDPPKSRKEGGSMKGKAKHVGESSDDRREGVGDKVAALDGVLKALSQLSNKLDNMDTNLGDIISAIGNKVDAIDRKVQQVEGEVSALKKTSIAREEKQCAADGDGGGSSGDKNNENNG